MNDKFEETVQTNTNPADEPDQTSIESLLAWANNNQDFISNLDSSIPNAAGPFLYDPATPEYNCGNSDWQSVSPGEFKLGVKSETNQNTIQLVKDNELYVEIKLDGTVTYGDGVTVDDAASLFFEYVGGHIKNYRDDEIASLKQELASLKPAPSQETCEPADYDRAMKLVAD